MDIFEQIKKIISPTNIRTTTPDTSSQKGLNAIDSIRTSRNLPTTDVLGTSRFTPTAPKPIAPVTPTPMPSQAQPIKYFPEISPVGKPLYTPMKQTIAEVTAPKMKFYEPSKIKTKESFAESPVYKFGVAKFGKPTKELEDNLIQAFNIGRRGENLTAYERLLKGVEGFGILASYQNEALIQPAYDTFKLAIKGVRTGKITDEDVNNYIYSFGGQTGTLSDALGLDEKTTDPALFQAVRLIDFLPELIDIPVGGPTGKTITFAKTARLIDDVPIDKLDDVAKEFEKVSGEVVSKEAKDLVKKYNKNPEGLVKDSLKVSKETPISGGIGGVPPSGKVPTYLEGGVPMETKVRKFPKSVENAKGTAKEVKKILSDRIDLYSPIKNKVEFANATKYVNENAVDDVIDYLKTVDDPREVSYIGQALMKKLQDEGNFARVVDVLDIVSAEATRSGQAIQALSVWGRLTPEGALKSAQSTINKYNKENNLVEGMEGFIKLTDTKAKEITDQAKLLGKTTDETQRLIETAKLQNLVAKVVPAGLGAKISAVQTLAQLLNPKTFIRNILGNAIFGSIDSVTQSFGSLLDLAISLYTKKRTIAPASFKRQFGGGVEGFREGLRDALTGADTSQLASQFDLPNASVFDSKIMQGLEKALNVTLKAPDRAFYQATYKDTLEGLMKLNKVDKPTKEMMEIAHYEGLRRTFQDETRFSKLFTGLKRALNNVGIKGFGLGDLILKYPKTPANLLARSLEYTPVGYVSAVMELARPLIGQAFDQRAFVNNIARATVGTGMINTGYILASNGILTPRPNSDKDARAAQDLQGLKSYSFNTSALKRYVLSGFDEEAAKPRVGDQLFSYDWAQPAAFPLAMGANIHENEKKVKNGSFLDKALLSFGNAGAEIIQSADTLIEQPLLTGLTSFFRSGNLAQGIVDTVVNAPASFVPTILNQINQYTDNASRETYSPNYFEAAYNKFAAKVPLLSATLPQRADILGKPRQRFADNSNTFFNVFFNPAFVDSIKEDPSLKETIQLFEQTGETTQFPRIVDKTVTVNGERKLLTTQEYVDYQRELGQLSDTLIKQTLTNPDYQKLSPTDKALFIGNMLSEANKVTKVKLFGDSPESLSDRQLRLQGQDYNNYIQDTLNNKLEQVRKENLKSQGLSYKKAKLPSIKAPKGRRVSIPKPKKFKLAKIKIKKPRVKKIKTKKIKPFRPTKLV